MKFEIEIEKQTEVAPETMPPTDIQGYRIQYVPTRYHQPHFLGQGYN